MLNPHAVERDVAAGLAVIGAAADLGRIAADDLRIQTGVEAGGDRRHGVHVFRAQRQRVEQFGRHYRLLPNVLRVDERRRAAHRNRLFESADLEVTVHVRGEAGRELDAFPPEGIEPGERERDSVSAWTKIDDVVPALGVADDRAHLFDEDRTGRFNRDSGEYGT